MMKKNILLFLAGIFAWQFVYGQPSFSEKRLRDKTLNEGITYVQQKEYDLAASSFSRCLELDSTFAPAWLFRGKLLIEWGRMDEALGMLDSAIQYGPALGETYFYKGYILYGTDTTGKDRSYFDQAISNGYQDPWAYYFRALTEIRDGVDDLAMTDLNRAIEIKNDFALAYHERAGIKRRRGDYQGAHFDYQQTITFDPDFALAYNNMGSVKILMGDYAGAIEDYSRALELDPELVIALNNRGYARYYTDDKEGALNDFNAAITGGDRMASAKLNKACLLAEKGEVLPALSLMDETLVEHPDMALLYLNRGLIRELTGDLDGACEDWHKAIELGAEQAREFINECDR